MTSTLCERLAGLALATPPSEIAPAALERAQMVLGSTFASAASGHSIESARILRDVELADGGAGDATVWFSDRKLPVRSAARVNAVASDAAASDDSDLRSIAHIGTIVSTVGIALARATTAFDAALQDLVTAAEARLRQLDRAVEQSLLSGLSAAVGGITRKEPDADPVEVDPLGDTEDDAALSAALVLVIATDTGCIVTSAQDLSAGLPLLLQFPDGVVPVRVEPLSSTTH